MQIVFCGPSRSRCGVCVTTTNFVYGLSRLPFELRWFTNYVPKDGVHLDMMVERVAWQHRLYARPSGIQYNVVDDTLIVDDTLKYLDNTAVFLLDYSASVIPTDVANRLLREAKNRGAKTGVRIHSQLLQGLDLHHVDRIFLPFPKQEAFELSDNELPEDFNFSYLPHPSVPKLFNNEPMNPKLVIGLGSPQRMPHKFVKICVEEAGGEYESVTGKYWTSINALVDRLSRAAVIVLFYGPINGVGRSSALAVALAAGRPIITSDCCFLKEAERWNGVTEEADLTEKIAETLLCNGSPLNSQELFYMLSEPTIIAATMVSSVF